MSTNGSILSLSSKKWDPYPFLKTPKKKCRLTREIVIQELSIKEGREKEMSPKKSKHLPKPKLRMVAPRRPMPPPKKNVVVAKENVVAAKEELDWISYTDSTNLLLRCMALEPKESTAFFCDQSYDFCYANYDKILAELEAKLNEDAICDEEGELEAQLSCLHIEESEEDWEDV
jgi:hypothetical protein